MRIIWRVLAVCLSLFDAGLSGEIPGALQNALAGNREYFTSDYLAEIFAKWQKQIHFTATAIDSQFSSGPYNEIWLTGIQHQGNTRQSLACLMTREPAPKLVDVRRVHFYHRAGFTPEENTTMDFIEKLLWLFEMRDKNLIYDFFYPEFISVEYDGSRDKNEIIAKLMRHFLGGLPLHSAHWQNRGPAFHIHLQFSNALEGMEIVLDIEKYLTVRAFEMHDKVELVRMLMDSLVLWSTTGEFEAGHSIHVKASSLSEALEEILKPVADLYHISHTYKSESLATISITPPSIDSLESASLKYTVRGYRGLAGDMILSSSPSSDLELNKAKREDLISQLMDRMRLRYGSLGLPAVFWPREEAARYPIKIRIHGHGIDSIMVDDIATANKLLHGLTADKQIFFFLQGSESAEEYIQLRGAGIWKDPHLYRHHLVKINESFSIQEGISCLQNVVIDLYPYIRTDYLKPEKM